MSPAIAAFCGAVRYEYRMQVRRPAVWIAVALITLLVLGRAFAGNLVGFQSIPAFFSTAFPLEANVVAIGGYFLPVVFGILLADRLPREHRLGTLELLESLPVGSGLRLWGKYVGAMAATLLPLLLGYLSLTLVVAVRLHEAGLLAAFLPVFALEALPGLLFVGAFSVGCPAAMPAPLYAVLYTGYWFWGNLVPPSHAPTISCTPLTPIGKYASIAFFGTRGQECRLTQQGVGLAGGIGSVALLLAVGAAFLLLVQGIRQQQLQRR
jgi:hypothetical protein